MTLFFFNSSRYRRDEGVKRSALMEERDDDSVQPIAEMFPSHLAEALSIAR